MAYWIDDGFDTWPEVVRAGKAAAGLYICCGVWVARSIGNGTIDDAMVPAEIATMYGTPEWITKLIVVGLWRTEGSGYRDLRYFDNNPTAEQVRRRRVAAARRQALVRNPQLRQAVRTRDRDRCRYCGVAVRWSDRKGPHGGTYDHVDPDGPNTYENLVVCCRGCNSAKGGRTPEQAGMTLRPPPEHLDTSQKQPRSDSNRNLGSSRPLPPPKGGREARPATPGAARFPQHLPGCSYTGTTTPPDQCGICAAIRAAPPEPPEPETNGHHLDATAARNLARTIATNGTASHTPPPGDPP